MFSFIPASSAQISLLLLLPIPIAFFGGGDDVEDGGGGGLWMRIIRSPKRRFNSHSHYFIRRTWLCRNSFYPPPPWRWSSNEWNLAIPPPPNLGWFEGWKCVGTETLNVAGAWWGTEDDDDEVRKDWMTTRHGKNEDIEQLLQPLINALVTREAKTAWWRLNHLVCKNAELHWEGNKVCIKPRQDVDRSWKGAAFASKSGTHCV